MWKFWLWVKESISGVTRNITSSLFATLLTFTSLFILAIWMIIGLNVDQTARTIEKNIQISMNLEDEVTNYREVQNKIENLEGVSEIFFVTKEEAYERMKNNLGNRSVMLDTLDFNPFPASFEIRVAEAELVPIIAEELSAWPEAKSVKYGENYVEKLMIITSNVSKGVYVIVTLIMIVSGLMIFFSVRLSIENRQRELEIKNLVGAGPFNIRIPFIIEGMIITSVAASTVLLLIKVFYNPTVEKITRSYPGTNFLNFESIFDEMVIKILGIALIIGFISSVLSTHRYINNS